jgi:hypothetical protein
LRGLIARFPFNGDALDHSGHNNNVIFNSARPAKGISGIAKTAYQFDGVSSYMEVANERSLNPYKISLYALFKPSGFYQGVCNSNRIISKGYNDFDDGRYVIGLDDMPHSNYEGCHEEVEEKFENFYAGFGDGTNATGCLDTLEYIKRGKWYSVVYTFDGVYSKLYVNGKIVSKVARYTTFTANSNSVFIGRNQDPSYPYYFKGLIDEIRIYKRVLSPKEVKALSSQD